MFIEAATTWGDIRRITSTKLALRSSCTRGCFHRRDQVSFFSNENSKPLTNWNEKQQSTLILIITCNYFKYRCFFAKICRHCQHSNGFETSKVVINLAINNDSLFFFVDMILSILSNRRISDKEISSKDILM